MPGFYSVACDVAFGREMGALPSGRRAGKTPAAGPGPVDGMDRSGLTALLNLVFGIDSRLMPNGCALNPSFYPRDLQGREGTGGGGSPGVLLFRKKHVQCDVLGPEILEEARRNPGKHLGDGGQGRGIPRIFRLIFYS